MKSISNFSRLTTAAACLSAAFVMTSAQAGDDAFDLSRGMKSAIPSEMTAIQIQALVTNVGYVDVYDLDIEHDSVEVNAHSAHGQKAKIYIDLATGRVLQSKDEPDNHDDDDRDHERARG